jgi:phosphoenolpyruvate synthase/pyruvate phosphate dikinase
MEEIGDSMAKKTKYIDRGIDKARRKKEIYKARRKNIFCAIFRSDSETLTMEKFT